MIRVRIIRTLWIIFLISLLGFSCSCTHATQHSVRLHDSRATTSYALSSRSSPAVSSQDSLIRSIDFSNVTYPNFPVYIDERGKTKRVTLQPGEAVPLFISYGDITGDRKEEAIVVLGIKGYGSAIEDYVYIFALEKGLPTLLWDFQTGDRADGGLRRIYAEKGELVIELFGKNRVIGTELYRGDEPLCCPRSFTRSCYEWTIKGFHLSRTEIEPNTENNANPVMPVYNRTN